MGRITAVLSENVGRLMKSSGLDSGPKLERVAKVNQKTINNIERSRHDPKLSTITKLAKALGVEAFQLLLPAEDERFLSVCRSWSKTDARGKALIAAAADAAEQLNDSARDDDAARAPHRGGS